MQRFIWMCVLLVHASDMKSCDICGCSVLSGNPGILPGIQSHFVGYRYSYRSFNNIHPPSILAPEGQKSKNEFQTHELWGRWYPSKKLQVFASLPINDYFLEENGEKITIRGLGDINFLLNYKLIDKEDTIHGLKQLLFLGAGLKLNNGHFDSNEIPGFQLGSGTIDWSAYLSYTFRIKKYGALTELNARQIGVNPNGYDFGNKLFITEKLFYLFQTPRFRVLPQAGLTFEKSSADRLNGKVQDFTGGQSWLANFTLDAYYSDFNIGVNYSMPIKQTVGEGLIQESPRIQISCLYFIQRKKCN